MGRPCHAGREPEPCRNECLSYDILPKGKEGDRANRLCPCHDDDVASLSINPGTKGMRMVWCCGAGCDAGDVRDALLARGVHPTCIGNYGKPRGFRAESSAPRPDQCARDSDAARWHAVAKLTSARQPRLSEHLLRMCIQAIAEGDGQLPGDPFGLLPISQDDFLALAGRTGIERSHRHKLYKRWLTY